MGAAPGRANADTCPALFSPGKPWGAPWKDDSSGTVDDIPGISGAMGNFPADGMAGTEGSGMPNCGSLVSKAVPE